MLIQNGQNSFDSRARDQTRERKANLWILLMKRNEKVYLAIFDDEHDERQFII